MRKKCTFPNFDKSRHKDDLNFSKVGGNNLEEVLASIETALKGMPFSVSLDSSEDEPNYLASIKSLIETIIEELGNKELPFELNRSTKGLIRKYLEGELLPKPLTPMDQRIMEKLPGIDLVTEDERRSMRRTEAFRHIYGDNDFLNSFRQDIFDKQMLVRTIIDTESDLIIDNTRDFNKAIIKYQMGQFKILRDFLINNGFKDVPFTSSMYRSGDVMITDENQVDTLTKTPMLVRTYTNVLQAMYNFIQSKIADGTLANELELSYVNLTTSDKHNKQDHSLYDAVNAYVNLAYFDEVLAECFGEYVSINNQYDQPITIEKDGDISKTIYKYSFEKGNSNNTKGYGEEAPDALKKMSKFQLVLIRSIPLYDDWTTSSMSYGNLEPKDFVGSFTKLMDVGTHVTNLDFAEAVRTFLDHPDRIEIIFKELFETRDNKTLLEELELLGLDQNNMNYIYSVYRTVFKGDAKHKSWKSIENKYIKNKGLTTRYFLVDTLLGVMDSNVSMNYAQTTYNSDTGRYETGIKARYSTNRTKFDIVHNVNNRTIDNANKEEVLNRYKIQMDHDENYTITLNNAGQPLQFTIVTKRNSGLLDKGANSSNLEIPGFEEFKKVDIKSRANRDRLISREGLSALEQQFMTVLDYIDAMLGTYFTRDSDGLFELRMLQGISENNLLEMFASASRALLVTDIYDKFSKAKSPKTNQPYSRTELLKFLEEHNVYPDKIQARDDSRKKEYFVKRFDGWQLNSLRANQSWIEDLAKARAIISGDTSKSVISNLDGDKIPNSSPGFIGARIELQLYRSNKATKASANLLFVRKPTAIKAKVVNTDVITKDGKKKQIKSMSNGELLYDAIVNKFIVPFLKDGSVFTQPTTFSDKTKFILYQISLHDIDIDNLTGSGFDNKVERMIIETIGLAYKEVFAEVKEDYKKIFPEYVDATGNVDLDAIENWMKKPLTKEDPYKTKEEQFTDKANKAEVTVYKDVHYRQVNGKVIATNELLYAYATNLFTQENLHARLEMEKVNFINDLLANRVNFEISFTPDGDLDTKTGNEITRMLTELQGVGAEATRWVKGNRLVLAKIKGKNSERDVTFGKVELKPGETMEINPILNAFFMLDNLIGNNLRYSLTGSEINHKVKALGKLNLLDAKTGLITDGKIDTLKNHINFIRTFNPAYNDFVSQLEALEEAYRAENGKFPKQNRNLTFRDLAVAIENAHKSILDDVAAAYELSLVENAYNTEIYKIENGAQNAQFKRNVIIPGTMRFYLQGRLNGIRDKMKVAVINDMGARVFNFDGKGDNIDAHDGAAFVNPFSSILENWSLQDCEVGTVKKPIQHWYDDRYMSATLLKYAVDTITNRWMLLAEGNDPRYQQHGVVLRNLFKKMTNERWHNPDGSWKFGEIDLIEGCEFREDNTIDFYEHILEGNSLFYRDGIIHKKIEKFGVENGVYYTVESTVESNGKEPQNTLKIYHYFKNDGEHIRSTLLIGDAAIQQIHTIDSLFELHTALGGIYSESIDEEGNLQYSEASNYAVAKFINNVATLKEGADPENLTQESYYQPLKEAMIDVLANNSAVKNGAGNMNPTTSFYDDTKLKYIEIGTNGYGIQMDADHDADEGHMTEFSQVISSLDAGGRLHDYVSQIYETLGKLAIDLSQVELDSVDYFRLTGNISKMYDVVGRTIMNNLSKNKGQAGLANAIITAIKEQFNLNTDHNLDEFKIPFSDPNIYSTILSTFVSVINKKSIKRQYPGLGTVMVPGYNLSMVYELNGITYQYEDLIKRASLAGYTSQYTDLSLKNKDIVQQFLHAKQQELPVYLNTEVFMPTDNVRIAYMNEQGGGILEVSLDDEMDYYKFKDDIQGFLADRGVFNATNLNFQKNVTVPRNLAPVRIQWMYEDETGEHTMNIFDHWAIKASYFGKRDPKAIQKAFDDLADGKYYRSPDDKVGVKVYHKVQQGDEIIKVDGPTNQAAELIMSNLYKTKFGIKNGDTLADVIEKGPNYFIRPTNLIMSDSFDLAFTKLDDSHLYITFKPLRSNDESFDSTQRSWKNKIPKDFEYPEGYKGEKLITRKFYTATNDNIPLFEVGREIIRKDVQYDKDKKKFVKEGKVLSNQSRFSRYGEDLVVEYIEFVTNNLVTEVRGDKTVKYDLYNINRSLLKRLLVQQEYTEKLLTRTDKDGNTYTITPELKFDEEVDGFISNLLADIYHTRDFNGIQVNAEVSVPSALILRNTMYGLGRHLNYDEDLANYVLKLWKVVKDGIAENGIVKYPPRGRKNILAEYQSKLRDRQYASFLKSQEFTASRIPAQTLQSFMLMRNVGFTGTTNNQCFVSHWLTWLQGSDQRHSPSKIV